MMWIDMTNCRLEESEEFAIKLDSKDPLRDYRGRFHVQQDRIYLDGNSLGLMSKDAETSVLRVLDEWKTLGIGGWLDAQQPWFFFAEALGALCARAVGAEPEEVIATGTTTVNIHALVNTFYQPDRRTKILADALTFPTDIYALRSLIRLRGGDPGKNLLLAPSENHRFLSEDKIIEMMDQNVALVFLPSVLYRSGQLLDMKRLTEEAHARDIPIGFDCSHSVGVVPHRLDAWNVDFAVWCSYKHLNGGPGGSAFLFVNRKHFGRGPALAGWFGYVKGKQFDLALDFEPAKSAGAWQISSPPILSAAPLEGSLRIILEAGVDAIREKSLKLTSYLMYLVDKILSEPPYNFSIGTPRETPRRGGHVAVEHAEAMRISEALRARHVISDYRPPNVIRVSPAPLYNTFHEVWTTVQHLKSIVDGKEYAKLPEKRKDVS
jgi:kynureninase